MRTVPRSAKSDRIGPYCSHHARDHTGGIVGLGFGSARGANVTSGSRSSTTGHAAWRTI